jgi:hypothetical protein
MGSFLRGAISFKDSLSQVRAAGHRLFILDAFSQRLVITNEAGDHQLSLDITDPSGLPTAIVGWSLGPSGHHVHILFVTQEQTTGDQPEYTFHHAVYDTKGHVTSRKMIPAMPERFRDLWPTDSGRGVLALGNRMVRGRMVD